MSLFSLKSIFTVQINFLKRITIDQVQRNNLSEFWFKFSILCQRLAIGLAAFKEIYDKASGKKVVDSVLAANCLAKSTISSMATM